MAVLATTKNYLWDVFFGVSRDDENWRDYKIVTGDMRTMYDRVITTAIVVVLEVDIIAHLP